MKHIAKMFGLVAIAVLTIAGCQTGGGGAGPVETSLGSGAAPLSKAEMYKYFADQTQVRDGGGVYYSDYGTLVSLESKEKHEGTWGSYDGGKLCRHFKEREDPPCEVYYRNGDSVAVVMGGKTYVAPKLIKGDQIAVLLTGSARKLFTREETIALVSGKTHVWENFNGAYYAPDGKLYTLWDGTKESGKWSVNDEGALCWHIQSWGHGPCEQYFTGPDGGLMSLFKGKEAVADEFRDGNVLDSL